jgi:hypothetical protein
MANTKSPKKGKYLEAAYEAYGIQPTDVKGVFNERTLYYESQLQKLAFAIIDIDYNKAFRWDKDYIREGLLINGYFTVTNDDNGILLPLKCGVSGVNVFNRGTTTIIANPVVGSFNRTIGVDCELVYLQQKQGSRFRSLKPIITLYAQKLANCDAAIDINLFNSRLPFIFQASDQTVADSFKAMYDEISQGNPAIFVDENMGKLLQNESGSNVIVFKGKENFIADVVQNEKMQILNEFLTTIGINTANTTKRERQVVDEVNANNVEIQASIKLWKQNVEEGCDRVNAMFPDAQLKITFPYYESMERVEEESVDRPEEGGDSDESD